MIDIGVRKGFNNKYKIVGDVTILYLENRKGEVYECYIDTEDLPKLIELDSPWHLEWAKKVQQYYCHTCLRYGEKGNRKGKTLRLHKFLTGAKGFVDHKNHNTLDNKKQNLRPIENDNNSSNRKGANKNSSTGVRNVCYVERNNEYWVQFCRKGIRFKWTFPMSQFKEACDFADIKRKEIFGEFAGQG
jgi:hypothetical protein